MWAEYLWLKDRHRGNTSHNKLGRGVSWVNSTYQVHNSSCWRDLNIWVHHIEENDMFVKQFTRFWLYYFCYPIFAILFRHVGSLAPKDFWNIWLSAYLMKITTDPRRAQLIFYLMRSYFNNSLTPSSICGNESMRSYNLLHSYRS